MFSIVSHRTASTDITTTELAKSDRNFFRSTKPMLMLVMLTLAVMSLGGVGIDWSVDFYA